VNTKLLLSLVLLVSGAPVLLGALRAGAARVDITPGKEAHPPLCGYGDPGRDQQGIHDPLHVRALVVDDGTEKVAVVTVESVDIPEPLWEDVTKRLDQGAGIRRQSILISSVHTHGAPCLAAESGDGRAPSAFLVRVSDAIVEAVRKSIASLKPARAGFGTGAAWVNINRRARRAEGGYWLGYNPEGVSDKTVGVLKVEEVSGRTIAVVINYAVHGTVMGGHNLQITADVPGATSRFVEAALGDAAVALWTSGAAGDQNPIYRAVGSDFQPMEALGRILGEEVIRVARSIRMSEAGRVSAAQRVITCPGQRVVPGPLPRANYQFDDAAPVPIRLTLLMIQHTALAGVSGEVLTRIGQRLKSESPFSGTLMLTHTNGSSGYLPDDVAYQQISYEIATSRVKKGCAEDGIVNHFLEMMDGN
jgi:hypothetical protein